ncbi:MAG: helix-turn-helix transcriptional regulator [bacterium]|nr:helix-turn-helix transcriptional regulator [bacterium]
MLVDIIYLQGGETLLSAADIIKKHIKLRGKSIEQLSQELRIPVKTLYDKLQNNRISTDDLFKMSILLDIDLEWMKSALGYTSPASLIERKGIKRMSKAYREQEYSIVLETLNRCISDGARNINEIKKELLATHTSLFYILDVLLAEEYSIVFVNERSREVLYVKPPWGENSLIRQPLIKGTQMLSNIIMGIMKG